MNSQTSQQSEIIYQDLNISIFNNNISIKGKNYYVDNTTTTQINVKKTNQYIPWAMILTGIVMLIIGLTSSSSEIKFVTLFFCEIPIGFGLTWLLWFVKNKQTIILVTNNEENAIVTSTDEGYITLLRSIIATVAENYNSLALFKHTGKEVVLYQDDKVTITNQSYKFSNRSLNIDLIENTKIEIDKNRKKLSALCALVGVGIFVYYGFKSYSDTETVFGLLIAGIGIFFWFKKGLQLV